MQLTIRWSYEDLYLERHEVYVVLSAPTRAASRLVVKRYDQTCTLQRDTDSRATQTLGDDFG
jgi:hypothetical protein